MKKLYMKKLAVRLLLLLLGLAVIMSALIIVNIRPDIPVEKLYEDYTDEYSGFLEIDGLRVHYRDEGAGEPLVLIHGWASSLHTWDGWAEELREHYRVIRMDLPAFGLTGPAAGMSYSQEYYTDFLYKFLTELDIEECYLAGNSMGGGVVWGFAHRYPDKVKKMILLNASGYAGEEREDVSFFNLRRCPVMRFIIRYATPAYGIRIFIKQVYGDPELIEEEVFKRYYRMLLREGNRKVLFTVSGDFRSSDNIKKAPEKLKEIEVPALIMWGKLDRWIPWENAERFREDLPNSKLIIYDEAGHVPMEEIPGKTAGDALNFLQ